MIIYHVATRIGRKANNITCQTYVLRGLKQMQNPETRNSPNRKIRLFLLCLVPSFVQAEATTENVTTFCEQGHKSKQDFLLDKIFDSRKYQGQINKCIEELTKRSIYLGLDSESMVEGSSDREFRRDYASSSSARKFEHSSNEDNLTVEIQKTKTIAATRDAQPLYTLDGYHSVQAQKARK